MFSGDFTAEVGGVGDKGPRNTTTIDVQTFWEAV